MDTRLDESSKSNKSKVKDGELDVTKYSGTNPKVGRLRVGKGSPRAGGGTPKSNEIGITIEDSPKDYNETDNFTPSPYGTLPSISDTSVVSSDGLLLPALKARKPPKISKPITVRKKVKKLADGTIRTRRKDRNASDSDTEVQTILKAVPPPSLKMAKMGVLPPIGTLLSVDRDLERGSPLNKTENNDNFGLNDSQLNVDETEIQSDNNDGKPKKNLLDPQQRKNIVMII